MKKQRKTGRRGVLALALAICLAASGCGGVTSPDELYALPQPPEDYENLNRQIEAVLSTIGGESIGPRSGTNTQTVQLQDLDGDGVLESAVAFFQVSSDEKPLKIYVFRLQEDDSYAISNVIEGVGTAINSVSYENMGGSPHKEVVVSWQISATDHSLGVYSLDDLEGIELMWVSRYNRFRLADLDGDGEREVVVITRRTNEEEIDRADFYDYDGGGLALKSTAPLSSGIGDIVSVRGSNLVDNIPAVFVTSAGSEAGQVVDVLAYRDGALCNITLDSATGVSEKTRREYTAVAGLDINGDGVMELPSPRKVPGKEGADEFWLLEWRQYDIEGEDQEVFTTYHNVTDGWYFIVPKRWVDRITISRRDSTSADERAVSFSLWHGQDREPETFMTIYKLTGTTRTSRATLGGRKILLSDSTTTYAYELNEKVWDAGLAEDDVLQHFNLIRPEWSSDS